MQDHYKAAERVPTFYYFISLLTLATITLLEPSYSSSLFTSSLIYIESIQKDATQA